MLDLQLTPQQHAAAIQGVQALFLQLEAELQEQLAKFEQHAVEGCLHVPAGLLAQPASAAQAAAEEQVDEAEEAAGQAEYQRLRGELEATRQAAHQRQRQIRQLGGLLEWSKAQAGQLGEVGKEGVPQAGALCRTCWLGRQHSRIRGGGVAFRQLTTCRFFCLSYSMC